MTGTTDGPELPELRDDRVASMYAAVSARLDADERERRRRRRTLLAAAAVVAVLGTGIGVVHQADLGGDPNSSSIDSSYSVSSPSPTPTHGDWEAASESAREDASEPLSKQELAASGKFFRTSCPYCHSSARLDSFGSRYTSPLVPEDWLVTDELLAASGDAVLDVDDAGRQAVALERWVAGVDGHVDLRSVDDTDDGAAALLRVRLPAAELDELQRHLVALDGDAEVTIRRSAGSADFAASTARAPMARDAVLYVSLTSPRPPEEDGVVRPVVADALPWLGGALAGALAGALGVRALHRLRTRRAR